MKWIDMSVSDKLPEEGDRVLIAIVATNDMMWAKGYYIDGKWYQSRGGGFSDYGLTQITHFMEVEPPNEI